MTVASYLLNLLSIPMKYVKRSNVKAYDSHYRPVCRPSPGLQYSGYSSEIIVSLVNRQYFGFNLEAEIEMTMKAC